MIETYQLGRGLRQYMDGRAQYCTLVLTEQCNLRCKYCYQLDKNANHTMSRDVAMRAIDFLFEIPDPADGIVLEFTGGECSLEIGLMREVIEYFKRQLWCHTGHPWRSSYVLMMSTNGTLYHTQEVQQVLWENRGHIHPAITIDGSKRKHDRARIFASGLGSYDIVARNVKLWLRQYPDAATKITFSSDDLPYVCESIIAVWDMGIRNVAANAVFEDVWRPGDAELYEAELRKLADIALERGFWRTHSCNLFWIPARQRPQTPEDDRNWCGTGRMMSIDAQGNLFPCLRFQSFCLGHKPGRPVGSIYTGFELDLVRPFHCLRKSLQSPEKCLKCTMSDQCAWCTALNYDEADTDTLFQRATFICEMHKARWRANQYYWAELERKHGISIVAESDAGMHLGCQA